MKLVFLYGMPATGKYTVAKELAAHTGYRLFHNHLVVDMLLAVFPFGSESFCTLREKVWLDVFEHACKDGIDGIIFTFAPESTVSRTFTGKVEQLVARHGGEVLYVKLFCPHDVLLSRLTDPSRSAGGKITSVADFQKLHQAAAFDDSHMPSPRLIIPTDVLSPEAAAECIAAHLTGTRQQ